MDLTPAGSGRMILAVLFLAVLAGAAFATMEAGRYRDLTLLLLAFFAFRIVLGRLRSR